MDNRREHPRYNVSLSAEVYAGTDVIPGVAKNLSQGGLGLALPSPLPVQTTVGVSMFLVEDGIEDERTEPANLRGQVAWCTRAETGGFLAGISFTELQPADLACIQNLLKRLNR